MATETERLRLEVARLRAEINYLEETAGHRDREALEAVSYVERLEAEVERLRKERKVILSYLGDRACRLGVIGSYEGKRAIEKAIHGIEHNEHMPITKKVDQ